MMLPEFGMPGRLLSERTTSGLLNASWNEIVWMLLVFLIRQKSAPKVKPFTGSATKPRLKFLDFSGCRSGLPRLMPPAALPVQSAVTAPGCGTPPGQRIGSYAPLEAKVAWAVGLDSAGLGARNPSE